MPDSSYGHVEKCFDILTFILDSLIKGDEYNKVVKNAKKSPMDKTIGKSVPASNVFTCNMNLL